MSAKPVAIGQPITGNCLCGKIHIKLQRAKPLIDVCHCSMCRRWGGAFAGISGESFTLDGDENIAIYKSSDWAERAFCSCCGSSLWYRFAPTDHYSFLAGLFELPADFKIEQQIFVDEKPDWYDFAQQTAMKTGAQVIAEAQAAGGALG